jgi:hypothetical protein
MDKQGLPAKAFPKGNCQALWRRRPSTALRAVPLPHFMGED